jgi:hypothetical protein
MGDMSVESLFPESRKRSELGSSGGSRVLGLMPLAARHTAISPMRAVFGWLAAAVREAQNRASPALRTALGAAAVQSNVASCLGRFTWPRSSRVMWSRDARRPSFGGPL